MEGKSTSKSKRTEMLIYVFVAYGINYLFGIPFIIKPYVNPQVFVGFMVLLPMNAVFCVKMYKKENLGRDKAIFHIMFGLLLFYIVMMFSEIFGLFGDEAVYNSTEGAVTICSLLIAVYILLGKGEKRILENGGLVHKAFLVLILVLTVKSFTNLIGTQSDYAAGIFGRVVSILVIPAGFFLTIPAYIGEEYGWRGYLQGIMQRKFGKRCGVVLLGIVWELWHIPLWFTVYNLKVWEQPIRMLMAISLAIFIGYVYMKTQNIWLCAWAHYIYNMLSQIGGIGVIKQNSVSIVVGAMGSVVVLSLFLLKSEYGAGKRESKEIGI